MKLSQLAFDIGAVSSHHQVGYDLNVLLLKDHDIGPVKAYGIFYLYKNAGALVILYYLIPRCKLHHRRCDIDLLVYQRIKGGSRGAHADIGNLSDGILFYVRQQALIRNLFFTSRGRGGRLGGIA